MGVKRKIPAVQPRLLRRRTPRNDELSLVVVASEYPKQRSNLGCTVFCEISASCRVARGVEVASVSLFHLLPSLLFPVA